MGWNIERTREGEARLQQKETEKQRKVSESSQVTEDRVVVFYSVYQQINAFRTLSCLFFTLQGEFNPAPQDLENVILSRELQASVNQIVKNNTYLICCVLNR